VEVRVEAGGEHILRTQKGTFSNCCYSAGGGAGGSAGGSWGREHILINPKTHLFELLLPCGWRPAGGDFPEHILRTHSENTFWEHILRTHSENTF